MIKIYRARINEADTPEQSQNLTNFVNNLKSSNIEINDAQYGVLDRLYNNAVISLKEDFLKWPTLYDSEYKQNKYFEYAIKVLKVLRDEDSFNRYFSELTEDEKSNFFNQTMPKDNSVVGYNKLSKTVQYYDLQQKQRRSDSNKDFDEKLQNLADKNDFGRYAKFIIYVNEVVKDKSQQIESDKFKAEHPVAYSIISECTRLYKTWENNSDNLRAEGVERDLNDSILRNNEEIPDTTLTYSILVRTMMTELKKPFVNLNDFIRQFNEVCKMITAQKDKKKEA